MFFEKSFCFVKHSCQRISSRLHFEWCWGLCECLWETRLDLVPLAVHSCNYHFIYLFLFLYLSVSICHVCNSGRRTKTCRIAALSAVVRVTTSSDRRWWVFSCHSLSDKGWSTLRTEVRVRSMIEWCGCELSQTRARESYCRVVVAD